MRDVIYFDSCCLNRSEDDQSQPRIQAEAIAIERVLSLVAVSRVEWIASRPLFDELSNNPNRRRRIDTLAQLITATRFVETSAKAQELAAKLGADGLGAYDALHLATAAEAGVHWLLTVDDRFLRKAARLKDPSMPEVINPVDFLSRRALWLVRNP